MWRKRLYGVSRARIHVLPPQLATIDVQPLVRVHSQADLVGICVRQVAPKSSVCMAYIYDEKCNPQDALLIKIKLF